MATTRGILVWLHRWIGLTVGVLFALAAGTGALLVYETRIDELVFGPAAPEASAGRIPVDDAVAVASEARPGGVLLEVAWPPAREGVNVYRVRLQPGEYWFDEYIDAGSGERVFWRPRHPLLSTLRSFHTRLTLGEPGRMVVVAATGVGVPLLLLGLLVWWPRGGRWREGFRIRARRGAYLLNWDLHKVGGLLSLPFLLLLSVTGLLLAFPSVTVDLEERLHEPLPGPFEVRSQAPEDGLTETLTLEAVADAAAREIGGRIVLLRPALQDDDPVEVHVALEGRTVEVAVDRYRGEVLATRDAPEGLRLDEDLVHDLHVAELDSGIVRALLALGSLAGALLLATGVVTWWMRLRRRQRRAATD